MKQYACIFDLDGVLVDTAGFHYLAWKRVANNLGFDFDIDQNEQLKGISRSDSLDIILKWGGVVLSGQEKSDWLAIKNTWYLEYVDGMTASDVLPGVAEFLQKVKAEGYKIGLGSASKNAGIILRKIDLWKVFDSVIDGTKTTKSKPDPQVFTLCADELHIRYNHCVVFEDALSGLEAAKKAGMFAVGIGNSQLLKHADRVIPDTRCLDMSLIPFHKNSHQ